MASLTIEDLTEMLKDQDQTKELRVDGKPIVGLMLTKEGIELVLGELETKDVWSWK